MAPRAGARRGNDVAPSASSTATMRFPAARCASTQRCLVGGDPVDAGPPTAQGVADPESLLVVPRARYGETCTDRVAGPEQCAEVGVIGDPQRGDDEMVPATMAGRPALCSQ